MLKLPNWLAMVSSVGHGVLLALATAGVARIGAGLLGTPLSPEGARCVFGISCLVLCPLTGYFNVARLMLPEMAAKTE
jgi:hypothetical protein